MPGFRSLQLSVFPALIWRSFRSALDDNCFTLARAAAYSGALALFPGMLFVAALVFGRRFGPSAVRTVEAFAAALGYVLPTDVHLLLADYLTVPPHITTRVLVIAALAAIVFASDVMYILMQGFRAAYRAPGYGSFWREYGLAVALVFIINIPIVVASALMIFGRQAEVWLTSILGRPTWLTAMLGAGWWIFSLVAIFAALTLLYHVAPSRDHGWAEVWPGALLATLFWMPLTALFTFYVQRLARYGDLYGSVSTVMVLLIWMYILNAIILLGAQFNAELQYVLTTGKYRPPKDAES